MKQGIERCQTPSKQLLNNQQRQDIRKQLNNNLYRSQVYQRYKLRTQRIIKRPQSAPRPHSCYTKTIKSELYTGGPKNPKKYVNHEKLEKACVFIQKFWRKYQIFQKFKKIVYLLVKKVQNHRILTRNIVTKRNYTKQKILNMFKFAKHGDLNGIKSIAHTLSPLLINQKDDNRNTALYYAALQGNLLLVRYLLKLGANVNSRCSIQNTPIHAAFFSDNRKVIQFLLENGGKLDIYNQNDQTPLDFASQELKDNLNIQSHLIIQPETFLYKLKHFRKVTIDQQNQMQQKIQIQMIKPERIKIKKIKRYGGLYPSVMSSR